MNDNIDERYKNGKIYKIVCNISHNIYIGSTISILSHRLSQHKNNYKFYLEGKFHYLTSYDIIKNNDYRIELLEHYPCNNRNELETQEREYIDDNICVNITIPTRTQKESGKIYREKNKEKKKEYRKKWEEDNKEHRKQYHKERYEVNKERLNEQAKQYRIKNKERIREKRKIKILCESCDVYIHKRHMKQHQKSTKHLNNIK